MALLLPNWFSPWKVKCGLSPAPYHLYLWSGRFFCFFHSARFPLLTSMAMPFSWLELPGLDAFEILFRPSAAHRQRRYCCADVRSAELSLIHAPALTVALSSCSAAFVCKKGKHEPLQWTPRFSPAFSSSVNVKPLAVSCASSCRLRPCAIDVSFAFVSAQPSVHALPSSCPCADACGDVQLHCSVTLPPVASAPVSYSGLVTASLPSPQTSGVPSALTLKRAVPSQSSPVSESWSHSLTSSSLPSGSIAAVQQSCAASKPLGLLLELCVLVVLHTLPSGEYITAYTSTVESEPSLAPVMDAADTHQVTSIVAPSWYQSCRPLRLVSCPLRPGVAARRRPLSPPPPAARARRRRSPASANDTLLDFVDAPTPASSSPPSPLAAARVASSRSSSMVSPSSATAPAMPSAAPPASPSPLSIFSAPNRFFIGARKLPPPPPPPNRPPALLPAPLPPPLIAPSSPIRANALRSTVLLPASLAANRSAHASALEVALRRLSSSLAALSSVGAAASSVAIAPWKSAAANCA